MRIALIQMMVTENKQENIRRACAKIREAQGIDLAVLPEMFCCPYDNARFRAYGEPDGGETQTALSALAAELGIYLVGGSLPELDGDRVYNTCYVFGRHGELLAKHRKAHLFDIDISGGQRFMESETLSPGGAVTTFETEFGTMGVCICFDLRFEELARCMCLRGARCIFVPAAFNGTTGPAHWELLFRQRAVDNQCFTIGVSPARDERASYVAYGNSIAVDPWGNVLCRAGAEESTQFAALDFDRLEAVRQQLPILSARRTDLYELRECVPAKPPAGRTFAAIYGLVRQIPAGKVMTYGQIARLIGMPNYAVAVGNAMAACRDTSVPCHRVVDRNGGTKAAFDAYGPGTQRAWLEAEGVVFRSDGTVDLAASQWNP